MKHLATFINEGLFNKKNISEDIIKKYLHPKNKAELRESVRILISVGVDKKYLNQIDTSKITDMSHLFDKDQFKIKLKKTDISSWNVSEVKNMKFMFAGQDEFDCDLSSWDVSNVTNMEGMFEGCEEFNSDISSWDVSNVEDISNMFNICLEFKCDLSSWNVEKLKYAKHTFDGCESLEKTPDWYVKYEE